jgi:hypothetical protein
MRYAVLHVDSQMRFGFYARPWFFCAAAVVASLSLPASAADCSLSLSQTVVDFGESRRESLERVGDGLLFGTRLISLSASCEYSTGMALAFQGQEAGDKGFRFANSGVFTLKILSAQVDGNAVTLINREGAEGARSANVYLRPGSVLVPYRQGHVVQGSQFTAQVEVSSYVTVGETVVRNVEEWEGRGQFSLEPL